MPDSFGPNLLGVLPYRMFGEVDSPTAPGGLGNPQFGGSAEQMRGMFQQPGVQNQMQQFGMGNYDPSQIRQSPFFPNQFMQHHPQFGGALTGMMANAAMTPEAPLVSGAGSGISRAFQGMMGGPEMLRQYQVRQMMAPFQMQGMMMPGMEMQRKQELLQMMERAVKERGDLAAQGLENQDRHNLAVEQTKQLQAEGNKDYYGIPSDPTAVYRKGAPAGQYEQAPGVQLPGRSLGMLAPGMSGPGPGGGDTSAYQPKQPDQRVPINPTDVQNIYTARNADNNKTKKDVANTKAKSATDVANINRGGKVDVANINAGAKDRATSMAGGHYQAAEIDKANAAYQAQKAAMQAKGMDTSQLDAQHQATIDQINKNYSDWNKPQGQGQGQPAPNKAPQLAPGGGGQPAPAPGGPGQNQPQGQPPSPQTHSFSKSAYLAKHPEAKGQIDAIAAAAQQSGFTVTD